MIMSKRIVPALVIGLAACGGSETSTSTTESSEIPSFGALLSSDQPRESSPAVSASESDTTADDNLDFAISLYQNIATSESGNIAFAPYSISSALSMLYAGAGGNTESEIRSTLSLSLPREQVFPAFNAIDLALNNLSQEVEVSVVNNLWGQVDLPWKPDFLDTLAQHYGAGMNGVDFSISPESNRNNINNWIAEKTNDQIKDLLPAGSITASTRFIMTNAIYLNADWRYPFTPEQTTDDNFQLLSGTNVSVPTMAAILEIEHKRESFYDVFELPYSGDELSMVFIVPDSGSLGLLEENLSRELIDTAIENLESKTVSLRLPKFKASLNLSLPPALTQLGMSAAFDEAQADFSRMAEGTNLVVTDIVHKAVVTVDEKGTEAAAATGIVGGVISVPEFDLSLDVNRPFLFLIRHKDSNTGLFIGRVANPIQ